MRSRFEDIKQFYIIPGSEEYLFYQNDFRLLVDILLRNIENYNDCTLPFTQKKKSSH